MGTATDDPRGNEITVGPGVAETFSVHGPPQGPNPLIVVLGEIRDEIRLLRETIHDAVVGELVSYEHGDDH